MKTSNKLFLGHVYSRKLLCEMFEITDFTINTGVFKPKGHESIWLFVTENKTPDRTQYSDFLRDDVLEWDGQKSGRTDYQIINHERDGVELILFYRIEKYEFADAGFRYCGAFKYVTHKGSNPAHFILQKEVDSEDLENIVLSDIDALNSEEGFSEGEKKERFVNVYERNPKLRIAVITYHGTTCMGCGFDFEIVYGNHGKGFIEVHHLQPVSSLCEAVLVNPKTDMVVLCSNCHRMIHRKKDSILSLQQLIALLKRN